MGGFFDVSRNNEIGIIDKMKSGITDMYEEGKFSFFGASGTYVTYYSTNLQKSTTSEGFKDVTEYIGPSSPVRYGKIKDFILYGVVVDSVEEGKEENIGITTLLSEHEAILLNDTVIPVSGDSFIHDGLLCTVSAVKRTQFKSKSFYKIVFVIDENIGHIDLIDNQVNCDYTFKYDHLGTNFKCVLKDDEIALINVTKKVLHKLNRHYIQQFYDTKTATLLFNDTLMYNADGTLYYCPYARKIQSDYCTLEYTDGDLVLVEEVVEDTTLTDFDTENHIFVGVIEKIFTVDDIIKHDIVTDKYNLEMSFKTRPFNIIAERFSNLKVYSDDIKIIYDIEHEVDQIVEPNRIYVRSEISKNIRDIISGYIDSSTEEMSLAKFLTDVKSIGRFDRQYKYFLLIPLILEIGKRLLVSKYGK